MDRTLITFNLPNIITIGLMAAIFYGALALVSQFVMQRQGGGQ